MLARTCVSVALGVPECVAVALLLLGALLALRDQQCLPLDLLLSGIDENRAIVKECNGFATNDLR